MISLKGKWALITGASRGIGYLTALLMAEQGCNLILHSRKTSHTEKVMQEATAKGVDAFTLAADLADIDQVYKMLSIIDEKKITVDVVLNNAAVQAGYRNDYLSTPVSDFTISFNVNTIAPAVICYHFMPKMIARGFGRIVNTTSGISLDVQQAGYSTSKAALNKFTVDIGSKVQGTDVLVNLFNPTWCRTDMGGPYAPDAPETTIPGAAVGAFVNDKKSGRCFDASAFIGMSLEQAVKHAETEFESPY